jgi:hypothetical protein
LAIMTKITLIEDLKTGDLVLFSGRCPVSRTLRLLMLGKWSHIGMVVLDPKYDYPLLYESTHNDKIPGLDLGRPHQGVQMVPLHKRIDYYAGDIAVRRLYGVNINDNDRHKLNQLRLSMRGLPFEKSILQLLRSLFRYHFYTQQEDLSSIFCSELIAEAYKAMGMLPQDIASNNYTPMDFSQRTGMQLTRGYLGEEVKIKRYKPHLFRK